MSESAVEHVVRDLSSRAELRPDSRPRHHPGPPILRRPDPTSLRVLSERRTSDRCAVAITVNDMDGERCFVIAVFTDDGDRLRRAGGSEGPDRDVPGRRGPFLGLYAYVSNGVFFAGGRVQSDGLDIARVRLVWEDGYELEDVVQNRVVMFFGARESWEAAIVEFLDPAGQVIGIHQVFGPDER